MSETIAGLERMSEDGRSVTSSLLSCLKPHLASSRTQRPKKQGRHRGDTAEHQ